MSRVTIVALSLVLLASSATVAHAGPPWISIEYPANPHDPATRGALAVVHTYHHAATLASTFRARAIGFVNGQRTTIALRVAPTSRAGAYAVRGDVPRDGHWVLEVSRGEPDGNAHATALVALGPGHEVLLVRVPHDRVESGRWLVPRAPTEAEVDEMLRIASVVATAGTGPTAGHETPRSVRLSLAAFPAMLLLVVPVAWAVRKRRRHR